MVTAQSAPASLTFRTRILEQLSGKSKQWTGLKSMKPLYSFFAGAGVGQ